METIERDYSPRGVRFYYIYKALAHPEMSGYVTPFTLEERLMHVREAEKKIGSRITWLCDNMSNETKHALGNASNSEFVVDPVGVIVSRRMWSNPQALRRDLEKFVGEVAEPTRVEDLDLQMNLEMSSEVASGVVRRVQMPGRMMPLKVEPDIREAKVPFYVKLRAEVEPSFLTKGRGKMYLGFHLDRIYAVHWNNLTQPLEYEIESPEGVSTTPAHAFGPDVTEEADRDPREFLVDVEFKNSSEPLKLTARYFACDDANTFCIPVVQNYRIHLERDPDGGMARRGFGGGPGGRGRFFVRLWENDQNKDGKLSRDEVPERFLRRFEFMDSDGDGFIEREEMEQMASRFGRGRGPGRGMDERFQQMDTDGDGKISREEAPEPLLRRFDQMDRNEDSYLDQQEMRSGGRGFGGPR